MAAVPGTAPMEALAPGYHRALQSGSVLDLLPRSMGGAALEGLCGHLLGCHKADDLLPPPIVGPHVPAAGEVSELHNEEFKTDDFRMYSFKVERCTKSQAHDWTECPFAHPGEKAKRRDPRRYKYSGTACPDFRKGTCKRGDACPFAHGVFECHLHPLRYRTHLCKDGPNCTRLVCFFAHSLDELRSQDTPATSASRSPKSEDLSAMSICTGFEDCANSLGSFSSRASSVDLSDALHNKGSAAKLIHSAAHSMLSSSVSSTVSLSGHPPAKQGQLPGTDAAAATQAVAWLNPSPQSQHPSPIDPCLLDMLEGLPANHQYACALAWPPAAGAPAPRGSAHLAWGPHSSPTLALGNLFQLGASRASHIAV